MPMSARNVPRLGLGPVFAFEWITSSRRWQGYALRSLFALHSAGVPGGHLDDQGRRVRDGVHDPRWPRWASSFTSR